MKIIRLLSVVLCVLLAVPVLSSCRPDDSIKIISSSGKCWEAGFACEEIIPVLNDSEPHYIAGYRNGNTAVDILDNPCAKAVCLGTGEKYIIIVAVDCIGLFSEDIKIIEQRLKDLKDEKNVSLYVISTHSHACPDTLGLWGPLVSDGKNSTFMDSLIRKAESAARKAYTDKRQGKLFFGKTEKGIENLQRDSREPYIYDRNLYQLRFEPFDRSDGIRIINYAAHAEALGGENSKISADFPCYLSRKIKALTNDECIFIPGAIGGLISTESINDKYGFKSFPEENVVMTGEILADAAISVENEKELKPQFKTVSECIELPVENNAFICLNALGIISKRIIKSGKGRYGYSLKTVVSIIKIDGLKIVCIPGELFPELAYGSETEKQSIKSMIDDNFLVFGLCGDEIGYIVPESDFFLDGNSPYIKKGIDKSGRKHYEETNSAGPQTADIILDSIKKLNKYF